MSAIYEPCGRAKNSAVPTQGNDVAVGLCACGCGQRTSIAKRTDKRYGIVAGQHYRYIRGHHFRGVPKTDEHKRKLAQGMMGKPGYWTGTKMPESACEKMSESARKKTLSREHKAKIAARMKERIVSEETRKKLREHKHSVEERIKMSEAQRGDKGPNWQGGVSSEMNRARQSVEFRLWREAVFARDLHTCQDCGRTKEELGDIILHPHHLKSFTKYPALRYEIANGVTLCSVCHAKRHYRRRFPK